MALRLSDAPQREAYQNRFRTSFAVVFIMFGILFGRMWQMQVFEGKKWKRFADANRIDLKKVPTMRGRVYDRNGVILSETRPSFDIVAIPSQLEGDPAENLVNLAKWMGWTDLDTKLFMRKLKSSLKYDPVLIRKDISQEELARFLAKQYAHPGFEIQDQPTRTYPWGTHAAHLLGYVGQVTASNLEMLKAENITDYNQGDIWGISGIEKAFENMLRGISGAMPIIEDARGRPMGEEYSRDLLPLFQAQEPVPGNDLYLALDSKAQQVAEESFGAASGALVALDPNNGDVLALLSRPQFLPENFSRGVSSNYWKEIQSNKLNPMYDRALRGLYPPGSTFKIFTGFAGLEEQVMSPTDTVFCPGYYTLGRETKKCWNKNGHGRVNFHLAMKGSCDVYFYEMGRRLGIDRIAKYASSAGLGEITGIGINRESKGLVPTEAWKEKVYKQKWVGGETLSVAIGQGFLQVTPVQLAVGVSTLINGGKVLKPRLALRSEKSNGEVVEIYGQEIKRRVQIPPDVESTLRNSLVAVVNEPGGTAYGTARSKGTVIAGKTGTAQVVGYKSGLNVKDHAWFVAYAPAENPSIVVAVIAEYGGHGGSTAAPIAKKVIEAYLHIDEDKTQAGSPKPSQIKEEDPELEEQRPEETGLIHEN